MKTKLLIFLILFCSIYTNSFTQIVKKIIEHSGEIRCLKSFPITNNFVSIGDDDKIIIWNCNDFKKVTEFNSKLPKALSVDIPPDERKILVAHDSPAQTQTTSGLKSVSELYLKPLEEYYPTNQIGRLNGACSSSDSKHIFYLIFYYYYYSNSYGWESTDKIYLNDYNMENQYTEDYMIGTFSNNGKFDGGKGKVFSKEYSITMKIARVNDKILIGSIGGGYLISVDIEKRKILNYFYTDKNNFSGDCFDVSKDGTTIASANYSDDNWIYLWNVHTGKSIKTLKGHKDDVKCLVFSPDGNYLASGDENKVILIWDVKTGKKLRTLVGHTDDISALTFSTDGKYIISGSEDANIIVWDAINLMPELKMYTTSYEVNHGILSKLNKELTEQIDLIQSNFSPKGEFETTDAYEQRLKEKNDKIAGVNEFYNAKFEELKANKKQELDVLKERKQSENEMAIQNSRRDTIVKISNVSRYNADKQTYAITIKGMTKNVYIPIDKAPKFKENWKKAKVKCKKATV